MESKAARKRNRKKNKQAAASSQPKEDQVTEETTPQVVEQEEVKIEESQEAAAAQDQQQWEQVDLGTNQAQAEQTPSAVFEEVSIAQTDDFVASTDAQAPMPGQQTDVQDGYVPFDGSNEQTQVINEAQQQEATMVPSSEELYQQNYQQYYDGEPSNVNTEDHHVYNGQEYAPTQEYVENQESQAQQEQIVQQEYATTDAMGQAVDNDYTDSQQYDQDQQQTIPASQAEEGNQHESAHFEHVQPVVESSDPVEQRPESQPEMIEESKQETSTLSAAVQQDQDKSREVKVFDESQDMDDQMASTAQSQLQTSGFNPLASPQKQASEPNSQKQQKPVFEMSGGSGVLDSAASFNTSLLNDVSMVSFNMESTSQLGLGEIGQSFLQDSVGEVNLLAIKETLHAREMKIKQLIGDKQKLKGLLVKAKAAITKINGQYKNAMEEVRLSESKLQHANLEKTTMSKALEDLQKRRNGIEKSQVSQILARIKVGEIGYTLIQDVQHCCEWYRDNMIGEVQTSLSKEWEAIKQVNYSTVFAEHKQLEDSLTLCMNQYEERLRRANEYMEQSQDGYAQMQDDLKLTKEKTQIDMQSRDIFVSELIKKSNQVKTKVHKVFKGSQKSAGQDWLREAINDIELGVAQIYELRADSDAVSAELRDHVMDLYNRTVVSLLKQQQKMTEMLKVQENEWQATCNKLIEDQQMAKQDQDIVEEKLEKTVAQLNSLKSEHYKLVTDNQEQTEKLTQERQNSVNSEYLKNILMSYFMTADASVQVNLIRVVFQAMKFTDEEQERVLDAHQNNNQSMFSKGVGMLF